ncbi:MAG: hypothetical protein K8R02_00830 [Anaerohalosphaeraceae bacterium]|nr:hypothetical protein [Anaerohalosphaeraceae bacterium]
MKTIYRVYQWCKENNGLLVAIATIILVIINVFYLCEARGMRIQTKKLADISIEQFKIRAYPAISITNMELLDDANGMTLKFNTKNTGELPAYKFGAGVVLGLEKKHGYEFEFVNSCYYKSDGIEMRTSEYASQIATKESQKNIFYFPKNLQKKTFKHLLIFYKFKVPYDNVGFRYDCFAYSFVEKRNHWQKMTGIDSKDTAERYLYQEIGVTEPFFKDFKLEIKNQGKRNEE